MNLNSKKNHQPTLDISQIVHDLKNPLTTIIASVDFLKNNKVPEKNRSQFYDMIENESKNILNFINDILEISKLENESQARSDSQCNIVLVTSKVLKDLKPMSSQKNIKVKVNIPEDLNINIPEIRIKQILSNLISNSIKYNKKNGKINIDSYQKNNLLYIEVEDTGIGISDKEQQKIFDKFYRCTEAKKLNIEGTGLGLSIVSNIINAYSGNIKISSAINRGSKFIISLPI